MWLSEIVAAVVTAYALSANIIFQETVPVLEYFSPTFFQVVFSFSGFFLLFSIFVGKLGQREFRDDVATFYSDSKRRIMKPLLSGIFFEAVPNLLLWHSFSIFPVSKSVSLLTSIGFITIFNAIRQKIVYGFRDVMWHGCIVGGFVLGFFPGFLKCGLDGGFLPLLIPFCEVMLASLLLGIRHLYHNKEPLTDFLQSFSNSLFCLLVSLLSDGFDSISLYVRDTPFSIWMRAILCGIIYIGVGIPLKRWLLSEDGALVNECILILQSALGQIVGVLFFSEGERHSVLFFLTTIIAIGMNIAVFALSSGWGASSEARTRLEKDRRMYGQIDSATDSIVQGDLLIPSNPQFGVPQIMGYAAPNVPE